MREAVRQFAESGMEAALREHDEKKGEAGWRDADPRVLFTLLEREVAELKAALWAAQQAQLYGPVGTDLGPTRRAVQKECADVANFAMFLYDLVEQGQSKVIALILTSSKKRKYFY